LSGYLDDLVRVEFDHVTTKLRLVVNYATKDRTLRPLVEVLRYSVSMEELLGAFASDDPIQLPAGGTERMAFLYDALVHIKKAHKLNLRTVLARAEFAGAGMDLRWKAFCETIVLPLRNDVDSVRAWIKTHITEEAVDPVAVFARAMTGAFGDAPAAAAAPAKSFGSAKLNELAKAVRGHGELAARERDLLVDVEILEVELSKATPSKARLTELVEGFDRAGISLGAIARDCAGFAPLVNSGAEPPASEPTVEPKATPAPEEPKPTPEPAKSAGDAEGLAAERAQLEAEREALTASQRAVRAERDALAAERKSIAADRASLEADRRAFEQGGGGGRRGLPLV
jgi:hypothetical protein